MTTQEPQAGPQEASRRQTALLPARVTASEDLPVRQEVRREGGHDVDDPDSV